MQTSIINSNTDVNRCDKNTVVFFQIEEIINLKKKFFFKFITQVQADICKLLKYEKDPQKKNTCLIFNTVLSRCSQIMAPLTKEIKSV